MVKEMRVVGYAITGSEAVLCRIICEIRLKMAENGRRTAFETVLRRHLWFIIEIVTYMVAR